jgi:hypothetical protein
VATATGVARRPPRSVVHASTHPRAAWWTYKCGGPDPVHNPSVLDPTSTSRNFETIGKTAYLYYTQFHTQNCQQGPDRDLVRVPITVSG